MLVLFDQGTPVGIRKYLPQHTVKTAREQGWSTLTNSELLAQAEQARCELLLTPDKNLLDQQNLLGRKIAIVILGQNRWKLVQARVDKIAKAIDSSEPGQLTVVEIPFQKKT